MKNSDEDDIINVAVKTGLFDILLVYLTRNNVNEWPKPDTTNQQYPL
jgi:hypothetical protein